MNDDSGSKQLLSPAFINYLKAAYVPHTSDYQAALSIRLFARWWMEFCRNFIVVVAINYVAEKSGSKALLAFADFTYFVFFAFVTSHFNNWSFMFFPYIKNRHLRIWLNIVLWLPIYAAVFGGTIFAFRSVYEGLIAAQGH